MKFSFLSAALALTVLACNDAEKTNEHANHEAAATETHVTPGKGEVKVMPVVYNNVDASAAASLKTIVDQYLLVKTALAADKSVEAASAAKAIVEAANKLDKSLLTADQKKAYDAVETAMKDHASQIGNKPDDIKFQRDHFDELSNAVYEIVKSFGAGRPVYHDHCPMANDNQGAMWISETKEISNPYFGSAMLTCGTVEEEIK
jgi:hypothetical protein